MNFLTKMFSGDHPAAMLSDDLRERLERWLEQPAVPLESRHTDIRYVVVNTEATGLGLDEAQLLTIAAIGIDGGILAHRDALELSFDDPASTLVALLEFIGRSPVVFNADFNRHLLERAFDKHLGFVPELEWIDNYWLLPCLLGEQHERPVRLADWMKSMSIEPFQRHRALGDAFAIAKLFLVAQSRATLRGHPTARSLIELVGTRKRLERSI